MRKEATLPIAERMENVSFAEISIDPGEDIALPEAARRPGLSAALRQKIRRGDMPFEEDHARPFGQAFGKC